MIDFGFVMLGFGALIILGWVAFIIDQRTGVLKLMLDSLMDGFKRL